ncbi:hypothetical protein ACRYI5_08455 [Furfurilactobacillus sp. WILCCON 0119]
MSRKDRKQKIKDLLTLEKVEGPIVSLYLPLHPQQDNPEQDTVTFNSLIDQAKTTIKLEYSSELWNAYQFQIDKRFANGLPISETLSQGLLIYVSTNSIEVVELNFSIEAGFYIDPQPLLWPVLVNNRPRPDFDLLLLQKDHAQVIRATFSNQVSVNQIFNIAISETGITDTTTFFTNIDKQIIKDVSNQDKSPLILVANQEDQGLFRKVSKNQSLSTTISASIDPNLPADHIQLTQLVQEVSNQLISAGIATLQAEIEKAQGANRLIQTPAKIVTQTDAANVATLVLTTDSLTIFGDTTVANSFLKQAVASDTDIFIFNNQMTTPTAPLAILRHSI